MAKQSTRKKTTSTPVPPVPPVVSVPPVEEDGFGEIAQEIMHGVQALRALTNHLLQEIGRVEIHKDRLTQEVYRLDEEATRLLKGEAQRLGIPEGTPWRMTPEGKAMAVKE